MKLAMSAGRNRHYRIEDIHGRHFIQTGEEAGLPKSLVRAAIEEVANAAGDALAQLEASLPADFPEQIHESVKEAMLVRLRRLEPAEAH